MEIKTGYLYHIKDEYFDLINEKEVMINHKKGHSRPSYYVIKDKDILWFIPLSSQIEKYKKIIDNKIKKHGNCKTIMIQKIANKEQAILIQNAFPTIEKYIKSKHTVDGRFIEVPYKVRKLILENFNYILSLKKSGLNLFFTDIDKIKEKMLKELEKENK